MANNETLIKQLKKRKDLYNKLIISIVALLFISILIITAQELSALFVIPLITILLSLLGIVIVLRQQVAKSESNIIQSLFESGLVDAARSSKLSVDELVKGIAPEIGSDLFVNTVACEASPEFCAADVGGFLVEVAACRANKNSKTYENAKEAVGAIEFIPDKIADVLTSALKSLDSHLHAKGYVAADLGVAMAAGSIAAFAAPAGAAAAAAVGWGTAAAAMASTGPFALAVAAAAGIGYGIYEGVEACKKSPKCQKFVKTMRRDIVDDYKNLGSINVKKAGRDLEDSWSELKKGHIGKSLLDVRKAVFDLL